MSEIVFYDANPTVRAILLPHLEKHGLKVVVLDTLEQCEETLNQCQDPQILLLDVSRQPDLLPKLQQIVPRFIRDKNQCIITTFQPQNLARYLTVDRSECFFSHAIERPFKCVEFVHLIDSIAQEYCPPDANGIPEPPSDNKFNAPLNSLYSPGNNATASPAMPQPHQSETVPVIRRENRLSRKSRAAAVNGITPSAQTAASAAPGRLPPTIHQPRIVPAIVPAAPKAPASSEHPKACENTNPAPAPISTAPKPLLLTSIPRNCSNNSLPVVNAFVSTPQSPRSDLPSAPQTNAAIQPVNNALPTANAAPLPRTNAVIPPVNNALPTANAAIPMPRPNAVMPTGNSALPTANAAIPMPRTNAAIPPVNNALPLVNAAAPIPTCIPTANAVIPPAATEMPRVNAAIPKKQITPPQLITAQALPANAPVLANTPQPSASAPSATPAQELKFNQPPQEFFSDASSIQAAVDCAIESLVFNKSESGQNFASNQITELSSVSQSISQSTPLERTQVLALDQIEPPAAANTQLRTSPDTYSNPSPVFPLQDSGNSFSVSQSNAVPDLEVLDASQDSACEPNLTGENDCTRILTPSAFHNKIDRSAFDHASTPDCVEEMHTECSSLFRYSWLLFILRRSMVHSQTYTMVCSRDNQSFVMFIRSGNVCWLEFLVNRSFPNALQFLEMQLFDNEPLKKAAAARLTLGRSMTCAFSDCNAEETARQISVRHVQNSLSSLRSFEGSPANIYLNIPQQWKVLLDQRPCFDIPFCSILFDNLRKNAEIVIPPDAFSRIHFAMRPYRTPLNAQIQLNDEENELLTAIRMPRSIAELKLTGLRHVADTLYRLLLFEFADFVQ